MIFYVNNKIDQKKEFSYEELIRRFVQDEKAYENFLYGNDFQRCFLSSIPGTPDPIQISEADWQELWREFKRQVPNPKYKN